MTALINGLDQVENTLGHQVAYLSKWAPRARNDLVLRRPRLIPGDGRYRVTRMDAQKISGRYDLAYFDPPYNTNNTHTPTTRVRYASYYHFWTTVVLNDRPPSVGAANRRLDCSSDTLPGAVSKYESTKYGEVLAEIERLVAERGRPLRFVLLFEQGQGGDKGFGGNIPAAQDSGRRKDFAPGKCPAPADLQPRMARRPIGQF